MNELNVKQTISNLVKDELPEMTQEEAIRRYKEDDTIETKKDFLENNEDGDNSEESEHLKRIKKELLASLERVKQLAKKIYGEEKNKTQTKEKQGKQKNEKTQQKENTIEEKNQDKGRERE